MKKLLLAMFCVAALLWGGCSDSDDDPSVDQARLIGKWGWVKEYDAEDNYWDYASEDDIYFLEFREDGICVITDDSDRNEFRYTLEGNRLFMYELGSGALYEESRIDRLTASELVLAYDYVGDNGKNCTDKLFLKRIE